MPMAHSIPALALSLSLASVAAFAQQADFDKYDTNDDSRISQQEFQNQIRKNQSFENHDANQDDRIDEKEFDEAGIEGDYDLWDTNDDNYVDENEFYGGTFNTYDRESDGYWDNDDWDDAGNGGWFDV